MIIYEKIWPCLFKLICVEVQLTFVTFKIASYKNQSIRGKIVANDLAY